MISFRLTEDQELIRQTVADFARQELRPHARQHERAQGVPPELRRAYHQLGVGLVDVPEAALGQGLGAVTAALVREELAFGDAASALALDGLGAAGLAVLELGDGDQQRRLLAPFADDAGHLVCGALAYSELAPTPARADAALGGLTLRARRSAGGYELTGKKAFVINGGIADLHVVYAELDGEGPAAFAIEGRPNGLSAGPRAATLGLEAVHIGEVGLSGVVVPEANRLHAGGDLAMQTGRLFARLGLAHAARAVGLGRASYEYALAYAQERVAFGKPVAHFQAVAFMFADMSMEIEAARWSLWRAAATFDALASSPAPNSEAMATAVSTVAMAHAHAIEAVQWVTDRGVQILGGAGYVMDHPSEKWMRDAKTLALLGPTREDDNRIIAAAELGADINRAQGEPAWHLPTSNLQPTVT